MILEPGAFCPPACEEAVRLGQDDFSTLERLYSDGISTDEAPGYFSRSMLEHGVFYGIREGGELIAAAGTHLVVPEEGVAAIGSIYTRRDRRGRGLATRVTGAVTRALLAMNLPTIALNVSPHNEPARRAYERLGFRHYCDYFEGVAGLS
jgi:predicted GNAT family acetyltransferase